MVIIPGSRSLWEVTFHDVAEAIRLQLGFDYYFGSFTAAVAVLFFAPITILGNLLVISAFYKDPNKNLRSPSYILLSSLAFSDFVVGAVQTPLLITGSTVLWQRGFHFHSRFSCPSMDLWDLFRYCICWPYQSTDS